MPSQRSTGALLQADTAPPDQIGADEEFWRLVWDPSDVRNGKLQASAIPSEQLRGLPDRAVIVDRRNLASRECVVALAARQSSKKPADRVTPLFSLLRHTDVTAIKNEKGDTALVAQPDPTNADPTPPPLPENPAHALIQATAALSKPQAQKLRNQLLACLAAPQPIDHCFPTA